MSISLSKESLTICAKHWHEDTKGFPTARCCHGCPIREACNSGAGGTLESLEAWRKRCNDAASQVIGGLVMS